MLTEIAEASPRRGMMVVFSDLLGDVASTLRGLRLLRQRGHDVLVLHIMDDDELDFPFDGPTRFEGLELPDHLNCNPRALREGYLEAVERFPRGAAPRLRPRRGRLRADSHQRAARRGARGVFEPPRRHASRSAHRYNDATKSDL